MPGRLFFAWTSADNFKLTSKWLAAKIISIFPSLSIFESKNFEILSKKGFQWRVSLKDKRECIHSTSWWNRFRFLSIKRRWCLSIRNKTFSLAAADKFRYGSESTFTVIQETCSWRGEIKRKVIETLYQSRADWRIATKSFLDVAFLKRSEAIAVNPLMLKDFLARLQWTVMSAYLNMKAAGCCKRK